ncbi:MAG: ATP-binding cassette domain-containing protein, partial [candidate division NC10 bacterium]|nr:ATP-binding cassette domain-containing protein [candidate division NC10 bacterium]
METEIIRTFDLIKCFGGIVALNKVSLNIRKGQILGVIGPNGAGKTALINVINGVYKPDGGEVYFKNVRLNRLKAYEVAQLGISRTFQITRIFRRMPVLENMLSSSIYLIGK